MKPLRVAITADLHWGIRPAGDAATRLLLDFLKAKPPDVLILAGDCGAGDEFPACLALFRDLPCAKALVPGNHDIWVESDDARGDSLAVYREYLPKVAEEHGFRYLDQRPLAFPSINWYDYSWSVDALRQAIPDADERLRTKRFSRGRHNDGRFVRWPTDDVRFTADVVDTLARHIDLALDVVEQVIVVTHHPAFYGLNFPRPGPPSVPDGLLWDAFSGNRRLEAVLTERAAHIPLVFSGHTHRARENTLGPIKGYNIGGDYHFKRLLQLDWPAGTVTEHVFGNPDG